MKEPERTKYFIQGNRGFMAIPVKIREELSKRGWKNKDTCWALVGEHGDWFIIFHNYEVYLNFMKFVAMAWARDKTLARHLKKGTKIIKELKKK